MTALIRKAKPGDELRIAEFAIKLFGQHVEYDPERFSMFASVEGAANFYRSRFGTLESEVIVAEVDDKIVGFVYLEKEERNYANLLENAAWMHDLYVDETVRTEGIGKLLIGAAAEAAKKVGANKLLLSVAAGNDAAQQVFEKTGFRPTMLEMTLNL
jgi:GNAT superfamily N-acetyltransferase